MYAKGLTKANDVTAELVWYPADGGRTLRLAWLTDIEASGRSWYESVVDAASGEVVEQRSRYASAAPEGRVWVGQHPEAAGQTTRAMTSFSGIGGTWVADPTTSGNNVNAYLDRNDDNANNEYQPQTPASGTTGHQVFDHTWTDAWRTTADVSSLTALDADRDAAITQLFHYTNVMHDWAFGYGFDAASGNFRANNFGLGGQGGDPVLAEAQDGWDFGCGDAGAPVRCLNNADFGTPGDGASPRMQMFMWTGNFREGSVDGDVIAHEYGHGIAQRLVGGGSFVYSGGDQRGSLGEGWSDVISFLKWGDAVIGEYDSGDTTRGLRTTAYDTSTRTFQQYDVSALSGHRNGEIWASTLYDIRESLGIQRTTQLVFNAMMATPANPTFIDARNALLATSPGDKCAIWAAFAGRGLGTASTTGLDTVPTASDAVPTECQPTVDVGGPYTTPEGTDVTLTATRAKGTDATAGPIVATEWDLDGDGQYDDATGATVQFTNVGRDRTFTVGVRVTDQFGRTATDTATVTVTNVAPTVTIVAVTAIDEGGTVTVSGKVTDPGWLDTLDATIAWGDGAAAVPLSGTPEQVRPDATLSFSATHAYGDNGTFTVTVCAADDDVTEDVCTTASAVVNNVKPTAAIDTSGVQTYDGTSAFVLEAGQDLTVPASATDPGSDDITITWNWGDSTPNTSQTSLVNPPNADPANSPTVQPRDVTLSATHAITGACLYTLGVTASDDDGGSSATVNATVIVTGTATTSKGSGWWLNQYRDKQPQDFTAGQLQCYLDIVGFYSRVFNEKTDASTRAKATKVLNPPSKAPAEVILDQHLLAVWLNFANGSVSLSTMVDTNGDGITDTTFGEAVLTAEKVRTDPASTRAQVLAQKDILERISVQSG